MVNNLPHVKVKVIVGFLMMILCVISKDHLLVLSYVGMGAVLLLYYRIPFSFFWKRLKPLLPFFLFSIVFFPLYQGQVGVYKSSLFILRLLFISQILAFIFFQTSRPQFVQALYFIKVPGIFIDLIMFTLRFIDVFINEVKAMYSGLKSKGFIAGKWFHYDKYIKLSQLLGSLFIRAFKRSERIYLGMLSRGYNGEFVQVDAIPVPVADWIKMGIWLVLMLGLKMAMINWW